MRLGKRIYNEEGIVLLAEHVELTAPLITRLKELGFQAVYIEDKRTDDIVIPELVSEETRMRALREVRSHFRRIMDRGIRTKLSGGAFFDKAFRDVVSMIIDDLSGHKDAMIMLTDMTAKDHYLYQHSLNVCVYATMLGLSSQMPREELHVLAMGALLHDIGKTQIPLEMLRKMGKLSKEEFELMKTHAEHGFRILKDEPNISLIAAHCAFQHHERLDGSGYPRGLKGEEIHDYARLIAVVDSYDAMTSHRVYRNAMLPHQALEILFAGAGTLYDKSKIEQFRNKVAIYPIGHEVTLNTGETGVVVDLNLNSPHRPIVRILQNAAGEQIKSPYEIDLSRNPSVVITAVRDVDVVWQDMELSV